MRSCNRWVYDWEYDSDEFIDLGAKTLRPVAALAKGLRTTSDSMSRIHGAMLRRDYRIQWSGFQWTALAAIVPAACASLPTAVAQSENPFVDSGLGWYVGGGVGLASLQPDSYCDCMTISEDNDVALNFYAGLDINERYAVELHYGKLGAPSVDFLGESVGSIDYQVAGLNGLLYLFNSQHTGVERPGFSAFVKAGGGVLINDSSLPYHQKHETQLWLGAGDRLVKTAAVPTPVQSEPVATVVPEAPQPSQVAVELPTVFFAFDHSDLNPGARDKLDRLVTVMETAPTMKLRLEGHADALGSVNYNDRLSINRAESVRDYLVSKNIQSDRIELLGYGELKPAADNSTDAGRARNRRVEVHLFSV